MLNICYYSSAFQYGGAEKYLETLISGCLEAGFNCSMIINRSNKRFQNKLEKIKIPITAIDIRTLYSPSTLIKVFNIIRTIKPDLLHINLPGPWRGGFIAPVAKLAGTKYVVTTEHLPMFGPSIMHTPVKCFTKRFVDCTVTVSYENQQYLEKIHNIKPEHTEVVHNGIDIEQFNFDRYKNVRPQLRKKFRWSDEDLVFGIVGRITEQKGHKYALNALAKLSKLYPNIKLAVLGDGELLPYCKELTANLSINQQVFFLGFQNDMPQIYASLDVLLMPSIFEALPLTLLEAMATGIPPVASNINGIPEVVKNGINGLLVPPKDIESIVKAMELLYNDREFLTQLGAAARKTIEDKFTLKKMVKDTISVYRHVTQTTLNRI